MTNVVKFNAKGGLESATEVVEELATVEVPEKLLHRIPANVRSTIYSVGVLLGAIGTVAPAVAALLTEDAQMLALSVGGLALALSNLLAKANVHNP